MLQPTLVLTTSCVFGKTFAASVATSGSASTYGSVSGASDPFTGVVVNGSSIEAFYALQASSAENCWWGTITCPS